MNAPVCGSLFSGVGGMDLGLHRAGFTHAFFCEADEWRRGILSRHWPGVPIWPDVRDVTGKCERCDGHGGFGWHYECYVCGGSGRGRQVDLLAGGFPCQDLSVAGRRAGLIDGQRSSLFFEFARIADALVPPGGWVLIENVPGLLSSNSGRDFGVVLATLADLGFMDGAWRVLDARFFGVPQRRRRVFILARRAAGDRARAVLLEPEGGRRDLAPRYGTRADSAAGTGGSPEIAGSLTKGSVDKYDDNSAQANHLVPGGGNGVRRLTPTECERLMGWPDGWTEPGADSRRYAACGDGVVSYVAEWIGRRLNTETMGGLDAATVS